MASALLIVFWISAGLVVYTYALYPLLLVAPFIKICKLTVLPGVTLVGTTAFTCQRPTKPGASPENCTTAWISPIKTTGCVVVSAGGDDGAAAPLAGALLTGP